VGLAQNALLDEAGPFVEPPARSRKPTMCGPSRKVTWASSASEIARRWRAADHLVIHGATSGSASMARTAGRSASAVSRSLNATPEASQRAVAWTLLLASFT
jgi:hypothetical protein